MGHYDFVKVQEMCGSTILYTICLHDHPNVGVCGSPCDPDRAKALRECKRYCKQIGATLHIKT